MEASSVCPSFHPCSFCDLADDSHATTTRKPIPNEMRLVWLVVSLDKHRSSAVRAMRFRCHQSSLENVPFLAAADFPVRLPGHSFPDAFSPNIGNTTRTGQPIDNQAGRFLPSCHRDNWTAAFAAVGMMFQKFDFQCRLSFRINGPNNRRLMVCHWCQHASPPIVSCSTE